MTGPKPKTVPSKGVSLSGTTRLTYREAVALYRALKRDRNMHPVSTQPELTSLNNATHKLTMAVCKVGGFDENDVLLDPFR